MSEMTKREKEVAPKKVEKENDEQENSAARDEREKKYYYDDAHGYEIYDSETSDEETDEN